MRVLHWHPRYLGGGHIAEAVRGLAAAQQAAGVKVVIAARRLGGASLAQPGANGGPDVLLWSPLRPLLAPACALGVMPEDRVALRAFAPDVVHIHGETQPENLVAARVFRARLVISPYGGFHPRALMRGARRSKAAYLALARRLLYHRAIFHAQSPLEAADISRLLPDRPVYRVPPGGGGGLARIRSPRSDTAPVRVLLVGQLEVGTQGPDVLIEAISAARQRCPRAISLTLVGADRDGVLTLLRAQGARLGLAGSVVFAGARTASEIAAIAAEHDLYVQLARGEGPGAVEALCAGLPLLLAPGVGIAAWPEVAGRAHVRTVPPGAAALCDALVETIAELPRLRASAMAAAPGLRPLFAWDHVAAVHLSRYTALPPSAVPMALGAAQAAG